MCLLQGCSALQGRGRACHKHSKRGPAGAYRRHGQPLCAAAAPDRTACDAGHALQLHKRASTSVCIPGSGRLNEQQRAAEAEGQCTRAAGAAGLWWRSGSSRHCPQSSRRAQVRWRRRRRRQLEGGGTRERPPACPAAPICSASLPGAARSAGSSLDPTCPPSTVLPPLQTPS